MSISGYLRRLLSTVIIRTIKITAWGYVCFAAVVVVSGVILSRFFTYPHYLFYVLTLTAINIITAFALKKFFNDFNVTKVKVIQDSRLKFLFKRTESNQRSPIILIGICLFTGFYGVCAFTFGYLPSNLVGVYSLLLCWVTCFTGVFAYGQYVVLLDCIARIPAAEIKLYNYYFPARTDWLKGLSKLSRLIMNTFFVLGTMYTAIWVRLIPENALRITFDPNHILRTKIILNTPNDILFISSWVGVFALYLIGFPAFHILARFLIKRIVKKLKEQTIQELQILLNALITSRPENIEGHMKYFSLIKEVEATPKFPLETYSYLPLITSVMSLLIQFTKIVESLSLSNGLNR